MTAHTPTHLKPRQHTHEVDLGKETPALATVDYFHGKWYLGLRQYYIPQDQAQARPQPGKNGITVDIPFGLTAIDALLTAFNDACGTQIQLVATTDFDITVMEDQLNAD